MVERGCTSNGVSDMCTVDSPVVYMLPDLAAARDVQRTDDLSILPPSMQKSFLASLERNREAFTELAKL